MKLRKLFSILSILSLGLALLPVQSARANTYTVTTTSDSGAGSLRQAILDANANLGADTIEFDIPGCAGVCLITPLTILPILTDDATTIDGYSQPGAEPASGGEPATILIEISGSDLDPGNLLASGLNILSANNLVRGLAINRCPVSGIAIGFADATGNVIAGNYLGLDASGTVVRSNGLHGAYITNGATGNTIGGDDPGARNVITGNGWAGVSLYGANTSANVIAGNIIGLDKTETVALGNTLDGVWIYGGAHDNTVGGDTGNERNVISGNQRDGVRLEAGSGNVISGNIIGLKQGNLTAGNVKYGINIFHAAQGHTIGGDKSGEGNVISGNLVGVVITGTGTVSNTVIGNFIGTNTLGTVGQGNHEDGVRISGGAAYNHIGGDLPEERNLISGNDDYGIHLTGSTTMSNTISGNYIGVQADGIANLGNRFGIVLRGAANNTIGGAQAGEGNLISGNTFDGIYLLTAGTNGSQIAGNLIGVDYTGSLALPNGQYGISVVSQADGNTIGPGNLISGNTLSGIILREVTGTWIYGNRIGVDAAGAVAIGNESGILISAGAADNIIGGDSPGERNVISGNIGVGVNIADSTAGGNTISGNYIGVDISGSAALGNGVDGIYLSNDVQFTTIGGDTAGERNLISGNLDNGIALDGADNSTVMGNFIGVDASGGLALENGTFGMYIGSGAQNNTVGGVEAGRGNVISANHRDGIYIAGSETTGNVIASNLIGTDAGGTLDLGNGQEGLELDVGAHDNTIGPGNRIAFNSYSGILAEGDTIINNTLTQNSIFENTGLGIELAGGAHNGILAPVISSTVAAGASVTISGAACPGCVVEVFSNPTGDGEGQVYLGSATAGAGGNFSLTAARPAYLYLTATATGAGDGTSQFSTPFYMTLPSLFLPMLVK